MINNHRQHQHEQDNIGNPGAGSSNVKEDTDTSAIYLGESSLQPEVEKDKSSNSSKKDTITSSGVDDLQSNSDRAGGTDRAGTDERKTYGDIELNKGLEAQAKDEES